MDAAAFGDGTEKLADLSNDPANPPGISGYLADARVTADFAALEEYVTIGPPARASEKPGEFSEIDPRGTSSRP